MEHRFTARPYMENESVTIQDLQSVADAINRTIPGAGVIVVPNDGPSGQDSLLFNKEKAFECARWLRQDSPWKFDYLSNVTGIDWTEEAIKKMIGKKEVEAEPTGYLETVYHIYSMETSIGPLVFRMRTGDRQGDISLPSMTPLWRSAELQEREIFDLYGVRFEGHPDLRRILMWDSFEGHPMRKDYVEPDDYEYEPTPHAEVLKKSASHQKPPAEGGGQ